MQANYLAIAEIAAIKRLPYMVTGRNDQGTNIITFHPDAAYAETERRWRVAIGEKDVCVQEIAGGVTMEVERPVLPQVAAISHRRPAPVAKIERKPAETKRQTRRRMKQQV